MHPGLGSLAVIFLAAFLIGYCLAGLGVPLGIVVPIISGVAGVLLLIGK